EHLIHGFGNRLRLSFASLMDIRAIAQCEHDDVWRPVTTALFAEWDLRSIPAIKRVRLRHGRNGRGDLVLLFLLSRLRKLFHAFWEKLGRFYENIPPRKKIFF